MSTPNFHKVHARNFYVLMPTTTTEDVETGEEIEVAKDDIDFEDDLECACVHGREKGFTPCDKNTYSDRMGRGVMEKSAWYCFGKESSALPFNNFEFTQEISIHSGYYSGANYDWDISICANYGDSWKLSEYESVGDMIDDILDSWEYEAGDTFYGWNAGLAKMQRKNIKKWLERMIDKLSDEADEVCKEVCEEEYYCAGIFSNGEAVYRKVAA